MIQSFIKTLVKFLLEKDDDYIGYSEEDEIAPSED